MERFPSLERERERSCSGAPQLLVKTPDYHHAAEIIFAFPSLQLHLKSEHLQTGAIPSMTGFTQIKKNQRKLIVKTSK
jgi:hypothetical protein